MIMSESTQSALRSFYIVSHRILFHIARRQNYIFTSGEVFAASLAKNKAFELNHRMHEP